MEQQCEEPQETIKQRPYYVGRDSFGHDIFIVRYPLEICGGPMVQFSPNREREYAGLDAVIIKQRASYYYDWMENDAPLLQPGRVMVTREAMTRLGRMNILFYLNCHVLGEWADGAAAGEHSRCALKHDEVIWSNYRLTESLWLSVRTSGNRCRTVIRMDHERLAQIRASRRRRASANGGQIKSADPITPTTATQEDEPDQSEELLDSPF